MSNLYLSIVTDLQQTHLVDWVGYIAMACVVFSFAFSNMITLRVVNSIGALIFIIYGVMLGMAKPGNANHIAENNFQ